MKKNLLLRLCLMMSVTLALYSCRQESLLTDDTPSGNGSPDYYITSTIDKALLSQVSAVQRNLSIESQQYKTGKNITDSLMQGGTILTDQMLVAIKNGQKSYTFQLKRSFPTQNIENLILKKNPDSSYSGILVQYRISHIDKIRLHQGKDVNLASKTKIYKVNDLNINAAAKGATKTFTFQQDCYIFTYQTNPCSSKDGHEFGDPSCKILNTSGAAQAPTLISVENTCDSGGGSEPGGGFPPGGSNPTPGVPPGTDGFNTLIFASLGYQYYATEDLSDPNYVLYNKVAGLFGRYPNVNEELNTICQSNPDLFYYAYLYFQDNGFNNTTKAFIEQRLLGLINWYKTTFSSPTGAIDYQIFLNWAFKHLVIDEPDKSWQEFYDEYLANPCERIKVQREETEFKNNIIDLKGKTGLKKETGYIQKFGGDYVYKDNAEATPEANALGLPFIETNKYIRGYMHTHVNDFNYINQYGEDIRKIGAKIFSPADISYFMKIVKNAHEIGQPLANLYAVLVSGKNNYQIRFTGNQYQIKTFTEEQMEVHRNAFVDFMKYKLKEAKDLEFGMLKYVDEQMNLKGISLYRMNADGTTTEITLNPDKTNTIEINCP